MHFIYNLSIKFYWLAIFIASKYNPKAKLWIEGRQNWKENLPKINPKEELVWFHCASLGEFDQGLPIMREIKANYPSWKILVTFFSPSGMLNYSKRDHCVDIVYYLPIDTPSNANFFLNYFSPKKIYFVKYEFWANYIFWAKKKCIPIYSVCSHFRSNQHFFKWYGSFFRTVLEKIDSFYVQTETSKELLKNLGILNVHVVGDTRFDNVVSIKNRFLDELETENIPREFNLIKMFLNEQKAIIIGSSWPQEEELIIPFILANPDKKFIIAPHDISEKHILKIQSQLNNSAVRFTQLSLNYECNCLILDTIGHLSKAYYFGEVAVIGGGFTGKLHNILEPATFGLPVLFGPNHDRFPEAEVFLNNRIAFEFKDAMELELIIKQVLLKREFSSLEIQKFVHSLTGAAQVIVDLTYTESI
jgi:3-deoxy-D-manno-octulosonic-acid transferase